MDSNARELVLDGEDSAGFDGFEREEGYWPRPVAGRFVVRGEGMGGLEPGCLSAYWGLEIEEWDWAEYPM